MVDKFSEQYFELLNNEYKGINLTRITDFNDFLNKQIVDSIKPLEASPVFKNSLDKSKRLVDVGFGGGFPILPLANICDKYQFVGIETRGKKVKVVAEIAEVLGLKNVSLFHERIENVFIDVPAVVSFKAVGKVWDFLNKINTNQKLQVFFYKGPNFYTLEADQIKKAKEEWNIIEEVEIEVEGTEKRLLIGFENKNVPRGTKQKLVNLSSLI